ncbi:MAG: GAF domain-containing protein [Solirubrobacteraceae bacterium]
MDEATRGILAVARGVLEELDIEVVLERALEASREITGAHYAALGVLDDARRELSRFLTLGIDERTRHEIGPLPTGRGVLGELIRNPAPLRLADAGQHPHSYGFPLGHPPMTSFLGVPILAGGEPYGNLYLADKRGGMQFDQDDEDAVVLLAEFAGVAIDHARRYTGAEQERAELSRTVSALDATIQIAHALGGQTDLVAILDLVAKRGRALVSARALVIELCQGEQLIVATGAGELPADLIGRRFRMEDTVASAALRARQSQRLSDELNRSRFERYGLGHLGLHATAGLVVPLICRNEPYGVLVAVDPIDGGAFTVEHQRLLEAFAASAATAVATAQSTAQDRQRQRVSAAESERTRWARELHDETLQGLGSLRLLLATAQRSAHPDAIAAANRQAIVQLEDEIANLRALITELRPAALDQLGTEAAIEALADRLAVAGLDVDVSADLAWERGRVRERHRPELETAIYRIVQESLTNAIKHGHASRAIVELVEGEHDVRIMVRDNGSGFEPGARTEGFGLLGMSERAKLLDGTVVVSSQPGDGTTVTAVLPTHPRGLQVELLTHATG